MPESRQVPLLNAPTPEFLRGSGADHLVHMVLALAAELTATTEELDTLRRLLIDRGVVSAEDERRCAESPEVQKARADRRQRFAESLFSSLAQEGKAIAQDVVRKDVSP